MILIGIHILPTSQSGGAAVPADSGTEQIHWRASFAVRRTAPCAHFLLNIRIPLSLSQLEKQFGEVTIYRWTCCGPRANYDAVAEAATVEHTKQSQLPGEHFCEDKKSTHLQTWRHSIISFALVMIQDRLAMARPTVP